MSEDENIELIVTELPERERYKCDVCNIDFYKRYYSPSQNARALESHLQRQSHKHNVERRKQGLEPEKVYSMTAVGQQLGELVDRLGSRLEDLESIIQSQSHRLESLESSSVRSWLATVPEHAELAAAQRPSADRTESVPRPEPETPLARSLTSSQLGLPRWLGSEDQSDACSEDTTVTDITEEECHTSHQKPSHTDFAQSYIRLQNQKVLELSSEEESSRFGRAMMSRSTTFKPTEMERAAVYQYDGNNYAAMTQVSNMLERLMIWLKQHLTGSKLTTNLQYIHRTQSALNVQIRQRMNAEPRDAEDTELILDRLYSVLEHEWGA